MRRVFRFGYNSTLWGPPIQWAGKGRFDDPDRSYRVLYLCSQRLGVFLEVLTAVVPEPPLIDDLDMIKGPDDYRPLNTIDASYFADKRIGSAALSGEYADVVSHTWVAALCQALRGGIDASVLQSSDARETTQRVSRLVYERRSYAGIRFLSRLGHDIENWAVFEPFQLGETVDVPVDLDDPDLRACLDLYSLKISH